MYETKENLLLKFIDCSPVAVMRGVEGWSVNEHSELSYVLNGETYTIERVYSSVQRDGHMFFRGRSNGHDEYLIFDMREQVEWDELRELEEEDEDY